VQVESFRKSLFHEKLFDLFIDFKILLFAAFENIFVLICEVFQNLV
jgi:hypothetical protein